MDFFLRKPQLGKEAEARIVQAISMAEKSTRAELRVHLTHKIKKDIFTDAQIVFHKLGLYKTELRSAVLVYVVPKEKQFAIIGDIGIHEKVTDAFWNAVRDEMTESFKNGDIADGIIKGVELAGEKLAEYFPAIGHNPNELSNEISRN